MRQIQQQLSRLQYEILHCLQHVNFMDPTWTEKQGKPEKDTAFSSQGHEILIRLEKSENFTQILENWEITIRQN